MTVTSIELEVAARSFLINYDEDYFVAVLKRLPRGNDFLEDLRDGRPLTSIAADILDDQP